MNREEAMLQRLKYSKSELQRKQEGVKAYVNSNNMNYSTFEHNLISDLLYMLELKSRIESIELSLKIPERTEEE